MYFQSDEKVLSEFLDITSWTNIPGSHSLEDKIDLMPYIEQMPSQASTSEYDEVRLTFDISNIS